MAIKVQDVVKANMVVVGLHLLSKPDELDVFKRPVSTDVQVAGTGIIANVSQGVTEQGRILTLDRDRITLELSPSRSTINRDYPVREDLPRLAEVAWQAIASSSMAGRQPRAFGFNIEMIFDQDSGTPAFEYLSRRLFGEQPLESQGWQFVGGAGSLIFDDGGRRWTLKLEPRFNDQTESRVFLGVNLHMAGQSLPDEVGFEASLEASLREIWDKSLAVVQRLDETRDRHV